MENVGGREGLRLHDSIAQLFEHRPHASTYRAHKEICEDALHLYLSAAPCAMLLIESARRAHITTELSRRTGDYIASICGITSSYATSLLYTAQEMYRLGLTIPPRMNTHTLRHIRIIFKQLKNATHDQTVALWEDVFHYSYNKRAEEIFFHAKELVREHNKMVDPEDLPQPQPRLTLTDQDVDGSSCIIGTITAPMRAQLELLAAKSPSKLSPSRKLGNALEKLLLTSPKNSEIPSINLVICTTFQELNSMTLDTPLVTNSSVDITARDISLFGTQATVQLLLHDDETHTPICITRRSPLIDMLNEGRNQRFATENQRIALLARDGGCSVIGCLDRGHHIQCNHIKYWSTGGFTDLVNLMMLCPKHHHALIDGSFNANLYPVYDYATGRTGFYDKQLKIVLFKEDAQGRKRMRDSIHRGKKTAHTLLHSGHPVILPIEGSRHE